MRVVTTVARRKREHERCGGGLELLPAVEVADEEGGKKDKIFNHIYSFVLPHF